MADPTDLRSYYDELVARRARLDIMIEGVAQELGISTGGTPSLPTGGSVALPASRADSIVQGRVRSDEFFRLSLADAIDKYLGIMKAPQQPKQIVEGLRAGGILSNARNFDNNVATELKRSTARGRVVRTPSGWGLAEWYPAKPKLQEAPPKGRKKKKKAGGQKALPGATAAPFKMSASAGSAEPQWRDFMRDQQKAGKTLKEAAALWKQRKAAG